MTLNITVMTPDVVYQSADFRLRDLTTRKPFTYNSRKIVHLQYENWQGFVTYTGIGSWDNKDTSEWITEWLDGKPGLSPDEVSQILAREMTRELKRFTSKQRHTFVLVAFHGGKPVTIVTSNFENAFGKSGTVRDALSVSRRGMKMSEKSVLFVTGIRRSVSDVQRAALKRLAQRHPDQAGKFRQLLEKVNGEASKSTAAGNGISEDCAVYALKSDGTGTIYLSTPVLGPTASIMNGVNVGRMMTELMKGLGVDMSTAQQVQGASATANPNNRQIVHEPCPFRINPADGGYDIEEIVSDEFNTQSARSINKVGQIAGTGAAHEGHPFIPWILNDRVVTRLDYNGIASSINDAGVVTGTVQDNGKDSMARATLEIAEQVSDEGWTDGGGRSIDNDQNIVGIVRDKSKESGKPFTRPAVVDSEGEVRVFEDVPDAEFGSDALRRTPRALVLVSASPRIFDSRCIMWNSTNGSWSYVGGSPTNMIPVAMTDAGDVLAIHRDPEGNRAVLLCPFGGSWQGLNLPPGFEPTAITTTKTSSVGNEKTGSIALGSSSTVAV